MKEERFEKIVERDVFNIVSFIMESIGFVSILLISKLENSLFGDVLSIVSSIGFGYCIYCAIEVAKETKVHWRKIK